MPSYTITNTAGANVATIGVATTTGATFPIELIGQGVSLYGPIIATTQYRLMENFANNTPPTNPVPGMIWYNNAGVIFYYDGTAFVPLSSASSNSSALFDMLPGATAIDLTSSGPTAIYTDPNDGGTYHPTGVLLKPNGTPTATSPALVNLLVNTSEDVLENVSVNIPDADRHAYYVIQGTTHAASGGSTIYLEVSSPATGGDLTVDAFLFGFKT